MMYMAYLAFTTMWNELNQTEISNEHRENNPMFRLLTVSVDLALK